MLENPVMGREFRARMRGGRSHVITGAYTAVVALCVLIIYSQVPESMGAAQAGKMAAETGRALWTWGCGLQAVLLPLMVPAFTCGAITLEREKDLLELLLLTRQSSLQICLGKLGSGIGLGLMLVLASVPVLALSLILGGVAPSEMLATLCVLVTGVLAAGALGLAISSISTKTMNATFVTYVVVGGVIVGIPLFSGMMSQTYALRQAGSEWAVSATLLAFTIAAFPPAVALTLMLYGALRSRWDQPPPRVWRIATAGGMWCLIDLLMYVPPITEALMHGEVLLYLHPVTAILGVMLPSVGAGSSLIVHLWWISSLANLSLALWFLLIAVLRVQALRIG